MTPSVATSTEGEIPSSYSLAQNYPNPFNPRTTIRYQLGQAEQARLVVYNMLGREIAELATGQHAAGWHKVVQVASSPQAFTSTASSHRRTSKARPCCLSNSWCISYT